MNKQDEMLSRARDLLNQCEDGEITRDLARLIHRWLCDYDSVTTEVDKLAESIYQYYPKKVGKPAAIKAIKKAIKKHGADVVASRTCAYAKAIGEADQFTPHPSTWFNQERYMDDPKTWVSTERRVQLLEDAIYSNPCNPSSPGFWKLNQPAKEPTASEFRKYLDLKAELKHINQSRQ